jgi:hypothetical protein
MQTLANTLGVAGQGAAGVNTGLARAVGGLPDLVGAGLSKLGVPGIQPNYYTDLAQRGINAVAGGPAPQPQGTAQQLARTAGEGVGNALGVALPAGGMAGLAASAGRPITAGVMSTMAARPGAQALAGAAGNLAGAGAQAAGAGPFGQAAAGVAGSLAPGAATSIMRGVVSPATLMRPNSDERQRLIDMAQAAGIPLSPADMTGSKTLRTVEDVLAKTPFASGPMEAGKAQQQTGFNRAVMGEAGSNAPTALPSDLEDARAQLSQRYNDLTSRNNLNITPQLASGMAEAQAYANRYLPADIAKPLHNRIEDFARSVQQVPAIAGPDGAVQQPARFIMPGPAYQTLQSQLGQQIRGTMDGNVRQVLGNVRDQLRQAMDASISPQDQQAWRDVNQQYAAYAGIRKAMNRPSTGTAADGDIPMAGLAAATNNGPTSAYAMGRGPLNDLARLGQILKPQTPDSGTAQRLQVGMLLGGIPSAIGAAATGHPAIAAGTAASMAGPYLASKAYNSRLGQAYLTNQLMAGRGLTPGLLGAISVDDFARYLATPDQPQR